MTKTKDNSYLTVGCDFAAFMGEDARDLGPADELIVNHVFPSVCGKGVMAYVIGLNHTRKPKSPQPKFIGLFFVPN
jgi:hypothetical protein